MSALPPGSMLPLMVLAATACMRAGPDCASAGTTIATMLECQALTGDKHAQLELGRRYEAGLGVRPDLRRAAVLYRGAAAFVSGTTYIYSPGVGKARGTVIPLRIGPDRPGLAEAKYRLALLHLRGAGVRLDFAKARKLLAEAGGQGFEPAAAKLRELDRLPRT